MSDVNLTVTSNLEIPHITVMAFGLRPPSSVCELHPRLAYKMCIQGYFLVAFPSMILLLTDMSELSIPFNLFLLSTRTLLILSILGAAMLPDSERTILSNCTYIVHAIL